MQFMHLHTHIYSQHTHTHTRTYQAPKRLAPLMGDSSLLVVIKHFQAILSTPNLLPVSLPAPQTQAPAG